MSGPELSQANGYVQVEMPTLMATLAEVRTASFPAPPGRPVAVRPGLVPVTARIRTPALDMRLSATVLVAAGRTTRVDLFEGVLSTLLPLP